MWLKNGDHSALVSPQGGSILQWQWREHTILGPTRMVRIGDELKARGESHWCYPNFGTPPPTWATLGKHGPFRKILLQPHFGGTFQFADFTGDSRQGGEGKKVSYNLGTEGLTAKLFIDHSGKGMQRVPILPAFHPYFAVPPAPQRGLWVSMEETTLGFYSNEMGIASRDFSEAKVYERTGVIEVEIGNICMVRLDLPDDCTHIVVWSDAPSSYVCVEPIFGKPGTFGKPEGRWIDPGEHIECNVRLDFEPFK